MFVIIWWSVLFILFALQFWAVVISDCAKHWRWKTFLNKKNVMLQLTFNHGLTITGFRTTRPRSFETAVSSLDFVYRKLRQTPENPDNDAHISFMQDSTKQPGFIKWPTPADKLWIQFKSVLAVIEPPIPCGKYQRQYVQAEWGHCVDDWKSVNSPFWFVIDVSSKNWPYSNTEDMKVTI